MEERKCSECNNWKDAKCSKFSGYYPGDSPLAFTCSEFKERKPKSTDVNIPADAPVLNDLREGSKDDGEKGVDGEKEMT